jgi:hypothetical protein
MMTGMMPMPMAMPMPMVPMMPSMMGGTMSPMMGGMMHPMMGGMMSPMMGGAMMPMMGGMMMPMMCRMSCETTAEGMTCRLMPMEGMPIEMFMDACNRMMSMMNVGMPMIMMCGGTAMMGMPAITKPAAAKPAKAS